MKILLFGGSGQLGLEVQKRAEDLHFEVVSPVISEVNISDFEQVERLARKLKPTLIVNCAAYTNVDKAESEPELAYAINAEGARNVAIIAREHHAKLLHISTDFVFDGSVRRPLTESDPVNALSIYGKSKLAGEKAILEEYPEAALIIRTSSLHGAKGHNFVHIMLNAFEHKAVVKVINDRFMSVTWAGWLAEVILDLVRMKACGVVHACCAGALSWYDFALEIKALVMEGMPKAHAVKIEPIAAAQYPLPARRPDYSVMDCTKVETLLGRKAMSWKEGLAQHLIEMGLLKD